MRGPGKFLDKESPIQGPLVPIPKRSTSDLRALEASKKICRACMRGVRMFLYIDVLVARRPVMEKVADNLDCSLLDRVTLTPISALCAHSDPSQFDPT